MDQAADLERALLLSPDSRRQTKAKRMAPAISSVMGWSHFGALSQRAAATSERRSDTAAIHIAIRNRPSRSADLKKSEHERTMALPAARGDRRRTVCSYKEPALHPYLINCIGHNPQHRRPEQLRHPRTGQGQRDQYLHRKPNPSVTDCRLLVPIRLIGGNSDHV